MLSSVRYAVRRLLPHATAPQISGLQEYTAWRGYSLSLTPTPTPAPGWEVQMLYDGSCPLCKKEIDWLKKKDAKKGNISFIDITLSDYDPSKHKDIGFEQGMRRAHAITKDGEVVTDMEVFRRVYRAVGLGWVFAFTTVQPFSMVADTAYTLWANYRTQMTVGESMEVILSRHSAKGNTACGDTCAKPVDKEAGK